MSRIYQVFIGLLVGAMLIMFLSHRCQRKNLEKDLAWHSAALDSCLNAPEKVDTVYRVQRLRDTVRLSFTEKVIDTVTCYKKVEKKQYSGTYTNDLIRVRWSAIVLGDLLDVSILPSSSYRYPQVKTTRKIVLPARDVDLTGISGRRKTELYLYVGGGWYGWNVKVMDAGMMLMFRNGLAVGVGGQLNSVNHSLGVHTKVMYRLF